MLTPLTMDSFKRMQLNAGLFLRGFAYSTYTDAAALRTAIKAFITAGEGVVGATRGGGVFTVTPERRQIEVDGNRYGFVGDTVIDSIDAMMTGTMLEVTAENIKMALTSADVKTVGQKTTITMRTNIKPEDYIDSFVWVGELADGRLALIALQNAINENGLTFTFVDKGEGTIPFEMHAKQDDVTEMDEAPFEIIIFDKAA